MTINWICIKIVTGKRLNKRNTTKMSVGSATQSAIELYTINGGKVRASSFIDSIKIAEKISHDLEKNALFASVSNPTLKQYKKQYQLAFKAAKAQKDPFVQAILLHKIQAFFEFNLHSGTQSYIDHFEEKLKNSTLFKLRKAVNYSLLKKDYKKILNKKITEYSLPLLAIIAQVQENLMKIKDSNLVSTDLDTTIQSFENATLHIGNGHNLDLINSPAIVQKSDTLKSLFLRHKLLTQTPHIFIEAKDNITKKYEITAAQDSEAEIQPADQDLTQKYLNQLEIKKEANRLADEYIQTYHTSIDMTDIENLSLDFTYIDESSTNNEHFIVSLARNSEHQIVAILKYLNDSSKPTERQLNILKASQSDGRNKHSKIEVVTHNGMRHQTSLLTCSLKAAEASQIYLNREKIYRINSTATLDTYKKKYTLALKKARAEKNPLVKGTLLHKIQASFHSNLQAGIEVEKNNFQTKLKTKRLFRLAQACIFPLRKIGLAKGLDGQISARSKPLFKIIAKVHQEIFNIKKQTLVSCYLSSTFEDFIKATLHMGDGTGLEITNSRATFEKGDTLKILFLKHKLASQNPDLFKRARQNLIDEIKKTNPNISDTEVSEKLNTEHYILELKKEQNKLLHNTAKKNLSTIEQSDVGKLQIEFSYGHDDFQLFLAFNSENKVIAVLKYLNEEHILTKRQSIILEASQMPLKHLHPIISAGF